MSRGLSSSDFDMTERISSFLDKGHLYTINNCISTIKTVNAGAQICIDAQLNLQQMLIGLNNQVSKLDSMEHPIQGRSAKVGNKRSANQILQECKADIEAQFKKISSLLDASTESTANQYTSTACDMNLHIGKFLKPSEQFADRIQTLRNKLDKLIGKTKAILRKEEPYIEEKIMKNIMKESKAAGNFEIIQSIKQQSTAIIRRQQHQTSSSKGKQSVTLVALLSQNVNLLKEVKDRKVLNNDSIYECCKKLGNCQAPGNSQFGGLDQLKKHIRELRSNFNLEKVRILSQPASAEHDALQVIHIIDHKMNELSRKLNDMNSAQLYDLGFTSPKLVELQQEQTRLSKRLQALRIQLPLKQS